MNPEPEPTFGCPHCQMGTLHAKPVVFAHWFEGQFIIIPNFAGWVCNICGAREYDDAAIERLEMSLGPQADFRREASRRARPGASGSASNPEAPTPRPNSRRRV